MSFFWMKNRKVFEFQRYDFFKQFYNWELRIMDSTEFRIRSIEDMEDFFGDPHNAVYTATKLTELLEVDNLSLIDVIPGIRNLVETWPASSSAAFLSIACNHEPVQRARDFATISYSWGAGYVGRVLHHMICPGQGDDPDEVATVTTAAAILLAQLFTERSVEYVGDTLHAFVAPCLSEPETAYWSDLRIAALLLQISAQTCYLTERWPLDPYIFGVVNYLGRHWGRARRNSLIHMLLNDLCQWVRVDHKRQLAELLCMFTDQWPVAHSAELVQSYTRAWSAFNLNELLCELGRVWPAWTRVGFFVHLINLICPQHGKQLLSAQLSVSENPRKLRTHDYKRFFTDLSGSNNAVASSVESAEERLHGGQSVCTLRARPHRVLNRVLLLYDVSRQWTAEDQQRLRDALL